MILCPKCDGESSIVDSRPHQAGIRRRRKCSACGHRWSTIEVSEKFFKLAVKEVGFEPKAKVSTNAKMRKNTKALQAHNDRVRGFKIPADKRDQYNLFRSKGFSAAEAREAAGIK